MIDIQTALQQKEKPYYQGLPLTPEEQKGGKDPYRPSETLKNAVNLTILLGNRPLLLKGEPGCGKTRLAEAVARELGLDFYRWDVKSTSRAKDGLYRYDAVKRLQDAQLAGSSEESIRDAALKRLATSELFAEYDKEKKTGNAYLQYGSLGKAFTSDKQVVVLIDEIDKADIDFPNDLLRELDEAVLRIEEIGEEKEQKEESRPLIFITSNDEKDLPDAFLRRCLFHYIEFPEEDELIKIVQDHYPDFGELIETAVRRFRQLRLQMKDKGKKVTTSELIDWYAVLVSDPTQMPTPQQLESIQPIPYPQVLLKRLEDWRLLESA